MKKIKLAILLGNRGFFPGSVIAAAREEMCEAVTRAGAEVLCMDSSLTRYGAIETREEGAIFADFLKEHEGEYDGIIISLPNFGDENGIKEAIKDVNVFLCRRIPMSSTKWILITVATPFAESSAYAPCLNR